VSNSPFSLADQILSNPDLEERVGFQAVSNHGVKNQETEAQGVRTQGTRESTSKMSGFEDLSYKVSGFEIPIRRCQNPRSRRQDVRMRVLNLKVSDFKESIFKMSESVGLSQRVRIQRS
jgi:hypothetical protein